MQALYGGSQAGPLTSEQGRATTVSSPGAEQALVDTSHSPWCFSDQATGVRMQRQDQARGFSAPQAVERRGRQDLRGFLLGPPPSCLDRGGLYRGPFFVPHSLLKGSS